MGFIMEKFPEIVLEELAFMLEPSDLLHLSLTCKSLYKIFMENNIWRSKTLLDFGDLFQIYTIITTSTGFQLDHGLVDKFSHEPTDWRTYYLQKNKAVHDDDTALMDQADKEYASAQQSLETFQQDGNIDTLIQVTCKMLWILDTFPGHAGCYYILGFILFVLNKLEEAAILLQLGYAVDPSFEPIQVLEAEIERIANGYKGEQELLTEDGQLSSALTEALTEIFNQFDADSDGVLNFKELDNFIYKTNGQHAPKQFLKQMGMKFGADKSGYLTQEGFLLFYLEQTLDDPLETRNDLTVHGFNSETLNKNMEL